jgi:hypothetical protein
MKERVYITDGKEKLDVIIALCQMAKDLNRAVCDGNVAMWTATQGDLKMGALLEIGKAIEKALEENPIERDTRLG